MGLGGSDRSPASRLPLKVAVLAVAPWPQCCPCSPVTSFNVAVAAAT
jgi:hypothetical protein